MFAKDCRSAARACEEAPGVEGGSGSERCKTEEYCEYGFGGVLLDRGRGLRCAGTGE